jgi:hypothetical protein
MNTPLTRFILAPLFLAACSPDQSTAPSTIDRSALSLDPATPNFHLEVVLWPTSSSGFGLVKFRQPRDDAFVVLLDTWVRDLAPNTAYRLQRAVDTAVDDDCTSSDWLTLGQGLSPFAITTDENGTGTAALWRGVPALPGTEFDIHFRVIEDGTGSVVLQSECYQYTISL